MSQLSLNIGLLDSFEFSSFYPMPENQEIVDLLQTDFWRTFPQIFLAGDLGSGKSHLLQAACYRIQEQGLTASYISLRQLERYGVRVLEGLDHQPVVFMLDDIDLVIGNLAWETALVHLLNRCRAHQQSVVLSGQYDPHELLCVLPDLASRLVWGPTFRLKSLTAEQALAVFKKRARRRGLELPEPVLTQISKRFANNIQALMQVLDKLDRVSLHKGRKITRQLLQEIFPPESNEVKT